ncbi:hypothetical protein RJT34_18447 [Clitoria ternatea]|uniref:Uncharacterized protein n=1 Tax=Clitoria ternatea TaxID=43366 RepID=A0AAN9JBJ6_CLITE
MTSIQGPVALMLEHGHKTDDANSEIVKWGFNKSHLLMQVVKHHAKEKAKEGTFDIRPQRKRERDRALLPLIWPNYSFVSNKFREKKSKIPFLENSISEPHEAILIFFSVFISISLLLFFPPQRFHSQPFSRWLRSESAYPYYRSSEQKREGTGLRRQWDFCELRILSPLLIYESIVIGLCCWGLLF